MLVRVLIKKQWKDLESPKLEKRLPKYLNLEYPSGCIIAKATITDCVYVDDTLKEELQKKDDKVYYGIINKESNWDGYGFKLENVKKIEPISVNGKLSLWDYDYPQK